MENDEVIDHQEQVEQEVSPETVAEEMQQDHQEPEPQREVPLSAVLKERDKRKEAEMNAAYYQQELQKLQQVPVDDSEKYETVTKEELAQSQHEAVRMAAENLWIRDNPEKYKETLEKLPEFLKQRPNLTHAIDSANNRYQEAYELMDALTPRQKKQLEAPTQQKREAPHSPSAVPKAAALNDAVDVMSMSDDEYFKWRKSKKSRR